MRKLANVPIPQGQLSAGAELSQMRTVKVPTITKESASADFNLLLVAGGKAEKVENAGAGTCFAMRQTVWRKLALKSRSQRTQRRACSGEAFFPALLTPVAVSYSIRFLSLQAQTRT